MVLALKDALREIFRKTKLICLIEDGTFDTVDGTYYYYLDSRVLKPIGFVDEDNENDLDVYSRAKFLKDYPVPDVASTDEAPPTIIVPMKKVWCTAQPTAASTLVVTDVGTETADIKVAVRGISSGVEKTERLTLAAGINPTVTSANSYTEVLAITKDASVGIVSVKSNSSAITNIVLLPTETEKSHWKVRLHTVPDDAYTINYPFYRTPWDFINDEDVIPFDDIFQDVLLDLAEAILLDRQGDAKALSKWQKVMNPGGKLEELLDGSYFSENEDMRMGLEEINYSPWE